MHSKVPFVIYLFDLLFSSTQASLYYAVAKLLFHFLYESRVRNSQHYVIRHLHTARHPHQSTTRVLVDEHLEEYV